MASSTWDARDYAASSSAQQVWARELIGTLRLRGDEYVLDVGCGDGKVTAELARLVPGGRVIGVDSSAAMVELATARHGDTPNLEFRCVDARALAFDSELDVVFSNAVLHWVRDHPAVLRGVARGLRLGGRALLQMGGAGNAADFIGAVDAVIRAPRWATYFDGFHFPYSFYGPDEYQRWLPDAGLTPARVELLPKDMTHDRPDALAAWVRTTWHPFTDRVPPADRDALIADIVTRYLADHPVDDQGRTHVRMVRLEVEATREHPVSPAA